MANVTFQHRHGAPVRDKETMFSGLVVACHQDRDGICYSEFQFLNEDGEIDTRTVREKDLVNQNTDKFGEVVHLFEFEIDQRVIHSQTKKSGLVAGFWVDENLNQWINFRYLNEKSKKKWIWLSVDDLTVA